MRARARLPRAALVFLAALAVSFVAFERMTTIPGLVVIAPGYLVQAWLFERHWALGGAGYAATMIGASALFWTLLLLLVGWGVRAVIRLGRPRPPAG